MDKETYLQYVQDFNKWDWEKFIQKYFAEDIIFETPNYKFEGIEKVTEFFIEFHKGLDEILRAEKVLVDGNSIAAELSVDFYCREDRPDIRMRAMKKGDSLKLSIFVFYETKGDKISHVRYGLAPREPGMILKFV